MLWLVTTYWGVGVQALALIVVIAILFFVGGIPLLLNRYVLCAVAVAAVVIAGESYVAQLRLGWIDEGRKEERAKWEAAKKADDDRRVSAIAGQLVESQTLANDLQQKLDDAVKERDALLKRPSHVSKSADAACTVPLGFVRDHDGALPGVRQKSAVPDAPGDDNKPSGVPLSRADDVIRFNYAQCAAAIDAYNAENERRYSECVAWDKRWGTVSGCARGSAP